MGITATYRLIDERVQLVEGPAQIAQARETNDWASLRAWLLGLPPVSDAAAIAACQADLAQLESLNAPALLLDHARQTLERVDGTAYQRDRIEAADGAALAALVHGWWGRYREVYLDKAWDLIHWYCDSDRRQGRTPTGGPALFDLAVFGESRAPRALAVDEAPAGEPRYNTPERSAQIATALEGVDPAAWDQIAQATPPDPECYMGDQPLERGLTYAREYFPVLVNLYRAARERGLGVRCLVA